MTLRPTTTTALAATLLLLITFTGCSTGTGLHAVSKPTPAQTASLLDQVKSLEGEWTGTTGEGHTGNTTFTVSSNGSIVREIMLVGTGNEMTNIYHMDGPSLILTHYCAAGNQPRMRASSTAGKPGWINFECDSVTNWSGGDELYMGRMHLEIKDADHIVQHWSHMKGDKVTTGPDIAMTRKR